MGINKKAFKGTKQEFILVFHISEVMILRTWNRINYIVLMLAKLVLFYPVYGSHVAANVDGSILMIHILDMYQ